MISFDAERRKWLFMATGAFCLLLAFGLVAAFRGRFGNSQDSMRLRSSQEATASVTRISRNAPWVVYVTGAVKNPGVYEVPSESRVNDAVVKAGGFSDQADSEGINLAAKMEDGTHIRVPEKKTDSKDENYGTEKECKIPERSSLPNRSGIAAMENLNSRPQNDRTSPKQNLFSEKLNVNTATQVELDSLPGITPALAQAIVKYRATNGPFEEIEDLLRVNGIGHKRLESIQKFLYIRK